MPVDPNIQSSRLDRRFDTLKNKVEQQANAVNQQQQEAMARKGAATGAGNSGAFMKLGEKVRLEGENQKNNALMEVEGQREGAQAQLDEANTNRAFAQSEREGSQKFARQMAQEERKFGASEAQKARNFQSAEAKIQRGFSKDLFNKEMRFKERVQGAAEGQFDVQMEKMDRQFFEDQRISDFNMDMATKMFNKKDMMEFFGNMAGYDPRTGGTSTGNNPLVAGMGGGMNSQSNGPSGGGLPW